MLSSEKDPMIGGFWHKEPEMENNPKRVGADIRFG
jgi:hypothetical protein